MEDVLEFVVSQGNGVKGLSRADLEAVPGQYVQPLEERPQSINISESESIPVIDWEDPGVAASVCSAARKYGFFQLINHGIPEEVCRGVREAARRFFELPREEKVKYKSDAGDVGKWVKYGTSFSPHAEKVLEWRDFLSLRCASAEEKVDVTSA